MALQVGQIFHLRCIACNPPKDKFHVLAAIEPRPCFFLINSNPTEFQKARPHLMSSLLLIKPVDVTFLNHDSWLDCNELLGGHTAQALETMVQTSSRDFLGRLPSSARRAVRSIIQNSRVLPRGDIERMLRLW